MCPKYPNSYTSLRCSIAPPIRRNPQYLWSRRAGERSLALSTRPRSTTPTTPRPGHRLAFVRTQKPGYPSCRSLLIISKLIWCVVAGCTLGFLDTKKRVSKTCGDQVRGTNEYIPPEPSRGVACLAAGGGKIPRPAKFEEGRELPR